MTNKVLVVDDEKLIVKGIKFSLEQDGMEVTAAEQGCVMGQYALGVCYDNGYGVSKNLSTTVYFITGSSIVVISLVALE